jgi:hypothetical protein
MIMTRTSVTRTARVRLFVAAVAALLFAALLAGCSPQAAGEVGQLQRLAEQCPDGPLDVTVDVDGSGSQDGARISSQALEVVTGQAMWVAACGGRLRVMVFATNASETAVVFDESLRVEGATKIARLRRVPDRVEKVTVLVEEAYRQALMSLPRDGSDVMSQFGLAHEHAAGLSDGTAVSWIVVTDGLDTTVPGLADVNVTTDRAAELAMTVPIPDLSGIDVSVVGVGRTTGDRLPTSAIDGLKRFYTDVLAASGATSVTVATDYSLQLGRS